MDKRDRVQEDLLDSAVPGGEAELERHQDGVGIDSDETRKETCPVEVSGHEMTVSD